MTEKIAVVGAGLMGHGIAQIFAAAGHPVALTDINQGLLDAAGARIRANLEALCAGGVVLASSIDAIMARVQPTPDLAAACAGASFVFEAVFEDVALKQNLFVELDRLCPPDVVLCSNTSVISITQIGEKTAHRERIVGTHFWNPPYLIPLVEVIRTELTSEQHFHAVYELLNRVGKHPVYVHKDAPGFVGNRMQHALWREAFSIIDEGICDAATVDEVVRNSFGLRLSVLGPIENADLIGLDLTLNIHNYILSHLNASPKPSKTLRDRVAEQALGSKSGRGFLEWSAEKAKAVQSRVTSHLLKRLVAEQSPTNQESPNK